MIKIGTRGSKLALWQANYFASLLRANNLECEITIIKTQGDIAENLSFDKLEGKGFFTREIEVALLEKRIDVAVHSLKDLPTQSPEGLVIAGLSERANPSDVLLIRKENFQNDELFKLPSGARVGTSSQRRKAQITYYRPDVKTIDIRGNVPTRIQKLRNGEFDAIILAQAGIDRTEADLSELETLTLNPREFIPAPGQGIIAFQTREENIQLRKTLGGLTDSKLIETSNVERKILQLMGGGCHMPLGAYCVKDSNGYLHVWACFAENWQDPLYFVQYSSGTDHELAETIVKKLKYDITL
ncbi:MAG TPA: hydroxymethylbilane synthase [Membranihabitans sp.]|nr:hydroxymethylbilane synthase [Membranihabitans sp.]